MRNSTTRVEWIDLELRTKIVCVGIRQLGIADAPHFTEGQRIGMAKLADMFRAVILQNEMFTSWQMAEAIGDCINSYERHGTRPQVMLMLDCLQERGPFEPFGHHAVVTCIFAAWGMDAITNRLRKADRIHSKRAMKKIDRLEELANTMDILIIAKIERQYTRISIEGLMRNTCNKFCEILELPYMPAFHFPFPVFDPDLPFGGRSAEILPFRRLADGK